MTESPPSPIQRPQFSGTQFSVRRLMGWVTFVALIVGVLTIGYQASKAKRQLRNEISELREANDDLQMDLKNAFGQESRSRYAEKILFHVIANFEKYPDLKRRLANYENRKIGISLSALDDNDNLTYLNFYTMEGNRVSKPFCHSFLVQDEPFGIVDDISGEQSRFPRFHDGKWICGAGRDGRDSWYAIDKKGFANFQPDETGK